MSARHEKPIKMRIFICCIWQVLKSLGSHNIQPIKSSPIPNFLLKFQEESGESVSGESNVAAEWTCPLCQRGQADRSSLSSHLTEQHSVLPTCVDKLLDIVRIAGAACQTCFISISNCHRTVFLFLHFQGCSPRLPEMVLSVRGRSLKMACCMPDVRPCAECQSVAVM